MSGQSEDVGQVGAEKAWHVSKQMMVMIVGNSMTGERAASVACPAARAGT